MKYLILLVLIVSCVHAEIVDYVKKEPIEETITVVPDIPKHKYEVGQCFQVFDPETGKSNPRDIVRIEQIGPTGYVYRWRVFQSEWALDVNNGIGKFELFESMTKEVPCPK